MLYTVNVYINASYIGTGLQRGPMSSYTLYACAEGKEWDWLFYYNYNYYNYSCVALAFAAPVK